MRQRAGGFTLIELLVVIAIIAILAAMIYPVFVGAKERTRQRVCLSNLKQLSTAFQRYTQDWNGTMPSVGWGGLPNWCGSPGDGEWVYPEKGQLWPYTRNKTIYLCPSDRGRGLKNPYIKAPEYPLTKKDFPLSYSMNATLEKRKLDSLTVRRWPKLLLLIHEDRERINDGIMMVDRGHTRDIPDSVHYTGTTAAYADGHARWASKEEFVDERDAGYWQPGK